MHQQKWVLVHSVNVLDACQEVIFKMFIFVLF